MSLYGLVKLFRVTLSLSRSDALGRERTDHEAFCEEIVDIDGACLHIRHLDNEPLKLYQACVKSPKEKQLLFDLNASLPSIV
ncbi:Hypothetical protein SMAX5B_022566 [Scophthalmus maximus]|uniref:Uncharacterized protein n=1 Tax=Scophthalmus maximus TaxID=52904 RepID=A0A2U9C4S8_SCOMX|nr:Hypothetical protein SMAX5B_022566 [Scophthalmus maximus]